MANINLKVKTKGGQQVVNCLNQNSTVGELKQVLSSLSDISHDKLQVLSGFPPKTVDISKDEANLGQVGLVSGDTLIIQELPSSPDSKPESLSIPSNTNEPAIQDEYPCLGILMKHVVPADNSCLFTSINFVLNGKVDESGEAAPFLRELVAETILNQKQNFDEAVLGKPVDEYCRWIRNDTSWGGAIELAILSNFYGIEIAVVDTINGIINRFGEDQDYAVRVFLMFDGIHYDPLYLEPFNGDKIQTMFETANESVLREAETLAKEAKSSRQFTDVNKFTLKCMVCSVMLKGQVEAQNHAKSTGHTNFGEV